MKMIKSSNMDTSNDLIGEQYRIFRSKFIVSAIAVFIVLSTTQNNLVYSKPTSIDHEQPQHQQIPYGRHNDQIRAIHYHFDQRMDPFMSLHKFNMSDEKSNTAICNDGSPSGYYKRLNNHSKSWIIYLQGGGYCGSEEACQHRWRHSPQLMSSKFWSSTKSVDGILSSEPKDNPYLWNANHIYVPYCSSDSWTGFQSATRGLDQQRKSVSPTFSFMGSKIIEKVLDSLFDDLPHESSLYDSKFILLAGDSAGATGVILNLDKVNSLVQQRFINNNSNTSLNNNQNCTSDGSSVRCEQASIQAPVLRGIADSGWFLDNEPYEFSASSNNQDQSAYSGSFASDSSEIDCDRQRCTPLQSIRQAMSYWNGQVPASCAVKQFAEPWRCYFAYRAYQSLKTPLFVVQWLYDEAQLMVDNIIRPGTIDQWNYVNKLVSEMRQSLENVTALFAPSCLSHSLIIKQSWNQININGFRLPHILNSWEEETLSNQPSLQTLLLDQQQLESISSSQQPYNGNQAATIPSYNNNNNQQSITTFDERLNQQVTSSINLELRTTTGLRSINGQTTNLRPKGRKKKRNNNQHNSSGSNRIATLTNRLSRSTSFLDETTLVFNNNVPDILVASSIRQQEGADKFRLIDTCGWPQCNRDCPYLEQDLNLRPTLSY